MQQKLKEDVRRAKIKSQNGLFLAMNEAAKKNALDDDEYKMKRKKSKMKIANEKNPINQNSFHDWINNREVTFPDTISQNIDGYVSISANQVSFHGWISNREIIIFEEINPNLENCLFGSINRVSSHDWISSRG